MLLIYKLRVGRGLCDILQKSFLLLKGSPPPPSNDGSGHGSVDVQDDSKFLGSQHKEADYQEILGLY